MTEQEELRQLMAQFDDLDQVKRALIRETVIRKTMAETGESRQIVTEQCNAFDAMDQEVVLELTDGQPTTLADGLRRYIEDLDSIVPDLVEKDAVIGALDTLAAYPWPEKSQTG